MFLKSITALIFLLLISTLSFAGNKQTPFIPPEGKTLLLVGQDSTTIAKYTEETGSIPGGTMIYTAASKFQGLESSSEYGAGPQFGNDLLRSYPNSAIQVGLYIVKQLDGILAGKFDNNLKKIGRWIKKANRPVYLRIGYEFDLPQNYYEPEKYKKTFRYIVDLFRRQGVNNVAYVWHSYCPQHTEVPWLDWYPGDDYVDWFGASIFATAQTSTVLHFQDLGKAHGKPFMICESTPEGLYTVRGRIDYLQHIFRLIKDHHIQAFCYINSFWDKMPMYKGQMWADARIEKVPEIKELWLKEINDNRYLKASKDLFEILGWHGR